ncbi:MAG: hypothetical protein M1818_006253 [Claussenomyces sp. TS43310]|nr:MAG: hypothetical protein M1818_006253 [Claussenomyces sp. TS43310]
MASAIYHALGSQNGSIRLLQLNPGGWSDKISCDLIHTCLLDDLVFEALSYVWGDDADTVAIILCGRGASVRVNLASALRHLRLSDLVRNLWVDALCVNQMDVAERSQQVTLMGEIYTKAEKVVIWLGQARAGDSSTIDIMIQLAANDKMHWIKSKPSEDEVGFKTNDHLLDLFIFLRNPWWGRIWTIQEYILAQKTELLCGPHCFPGSTLPALAKSYFKHSKRCCNFPTDIKSFEISGIFNQMTAILDFETFRAQIGRVSFLELASSFRTRETSDLRDKIYGLLGLSETYSAELVDYSLSTEEAYEEATIQIISSTRKLNAFSHIFALEDSPTQPHSGFVTAIPTWTPNWSLHLNSRNVQDLKLRARYLSLFRASADFLASIVRRSPRKLTLRAVHWDVLEQLGRAMDGRGYDFLIYCGWRSMAGGCTSLQESYVTGGSWIDAFWRTLCIDVDCCTSQRADASMERLYDLWWWAELLSQPDLRREHAAFQAYTTTSHAEELELLMAFIRPHELARIHDLRDHIRSSTMRRRFFISKKGYIGLAPANAQIGDMVSIIHGGNVPYVLRRKAVEIPGGENIPHWELVGDAYVHGLMDGEATESTKGYVSNAQELTLI